MRINGGTIMGNYRGDYLGKRNGTLYCVRWLQNQYVVYCHADNHIRRNFNIVYKRPADIRVFLSHNECVRIN